MENYSDIKEELYNYSRKYLFTDASEYISGKVAYFKMNGNYQALDNILYTIDLSKLNPLIASYLIEETRYISDKLCMRKSFIEDCKKAYPHKVSLF